jgi:hypothetical protein
MVMQAAKITRRGFLGMLALLAALGPRLPGYAVGKAGTWGATGSMAVPRIGAALTTLPDGRALIVGGGLARAGELFDPATGSWTLTGGG